MSGNETKAATTTGSCNCCLPWHNAKARAVKRRKLRSRRLRRQHR